MEGYLETLNSANREFNKNKKLNELVINFKYPLKAIKSVKTKYGQSKVVTLQDQDTSLFDIFLPPRFNDKEFNMNYPHYLVFRGKKKISNGQEFNDLEFGILETTFDNSPKYKFNPLHRAN